MTYDRADLHNWNDSTVRLAAVGLPECAPIWDVRSILGLIESAPADSPERNAIANVARLAAQLVGAPIAAASVLDGDRVRLISRYGVNLEDIPAEHSCCAECIESGRPHAIEDFAKEEKFRCNPLLNELGVGHYLGVPLRAPNGFAFGTLCVLGPGPRRFTEAEVGSLAALAAMIESQIRQYHLLDVSASQRMLFAAVLEASLEGVCALESLCDQNGRIVDFKFVVMNPVAERLLETTSDRVIGTRMTESFPGVRANGLLEQYVRVAETGEPYIDEVLYDAEHLSRWFEVSAVRVSDGIAVTFRDVGERRMRDEEIARTNERFRLLSAATEDIVWDYDVANAHVWWNENILGCLGITEGEVGHTVEWWASRVHPEDAERVVGGFHAAIAGRESNWGEEYRWRRADGDYAVVLDRAFIIRDESGKAIRAVGAAIDLTARLRAAEEIAFQRSLLIAQAEASQDGILVTSVDGGVLRANRRFRSMMGGVDEGHVSEDGREALRRVCEHAANAELLRSMTRRVMLDPEQVVSVEVLFRDGRAHELRTEPLTNADGRWLGRVWYMRDLTRERRTEQLLRQHNLVLQMSNVVLFRWRVEPGWPVDLVTENVDQFGYSADELLTGSLLFADIMHPDDIERVGREVEEHIACRHDSYEQEYRIICRDGSVRWVYDRSVVERDESGSVESIQGVVIDITERRRVERELAESATLLREITAQVPGAVYQYRVRPDGTREFPYISEGVRELCGLDPRDVMVDASAVMSKTIHEDYAMVEASIIESARTLSPWNCEFRIRLDDGSVRWIGGHSIPRREPDGSILWHGLITDITARKSTEENMRRLTDLMERTNVIARVGGWELDVETESLYMSSEVYRILGIEPGVRVSLGGVMGYFTPESRVKLADAVRCASERGDPYDLEVELVTARGKGIWVRAQGEAVWSGGRIIKVRGALHDINDQYIARRELARRAKEFELLRDAAEASNRAKSEFVANMSHEIRTPLTAILGFAELLLEGDNSPEGAEHRRQAVDTIRAAGQHLLTIINDILDISKIEAGRMKIDRVETHLPDLLAETITLMSVRAESKGIVLSSRVAAPIPVRVNVDPTRLRQALLNLIGNAVKFTEVGRVHVVIDVLGQPGEQELVVDIEDTGPGIEENQRDRLFANFSQADSSLRRRHGGTGLGLAISRRCIELLGGGVTLERTEPGVGSCFRIRLPLEVVEGSPYVRELDESQSEQVVSDTPRVSLRGRVLLAEDGPDNQRLITFHLSKAGAEVDVAANGRIALEMIDASEQAGAPYDLLLTDVQMPEMDGLELAALLRSRGSTLPIIAITAHAMTEDCARCLRAGCDAYTAKPVDRKKLLEVCNVWIGRRGGAGKACGRAA